MVQRRRRNSQQLVQNEVTPLPSLNIPVSQRVVDSHKTKCFISSFLFLLVFLVVESVEEIVFEPTNGKNDGKSHYKTGKLQTTYEEPVIVGWSIVF